MSRTTIATLAGLCLAALVAAQLGGDRAVGVLGGALLAASVTGVGLAWQRRLLREDRSRMTAAIGYGFLLKLGALGIGVLCLRYAEPFQGVADWQSFAVAFVATAFLVSIPGAMDNARAARGDPARSGQPAGRSVLAPPTEGRVL